MLRLTLIIDKGCIHAIIYTDIHSRGLMVYKAIKTFEVIEGSTENMYYKIEVRFGSTVVDTFHEPTMRQAISAFEYAGYKRVPNRS